MRYPYLHLMYLGVPCSNLIKSTRFHAKPIQLKRFSSKKFNSTTVTTFPTGKLERNYRVDAIRLAENQTFIYLKLALQVKRVYLRLKGFLPKL